MTTFGSFYGIINMIDNFNIGTGNSIGCYKLVTVQNREGNVVNFVIEPTTYFVDHIMMTVGDMVIGYYDANAPVPFIYPPQFRALVISKLLQGQNVKVDYFNEQLVSSDASLKLNIAPSTQITLENNQVFTGNLENRNLIVVYGVTTKSIPAQTTPYKIIVMCKKT